jgi:hypothetical protein
MACVLFYTQESTTGEHREKARARVEADEESLLSHLSPVVAIRTIVRVVRHQEKATAYNTLILLSMDVLFALIVAIRAGIAVLYPELKFGWTLVEIGMLQSATALYRVGILLIVMPLAIRLAQHIWNEHRQSHEVTKTDKLVLAVANLAETIGYSGYAIATNGWQYAVSYFIATTGVVAKPVVQASLMNIVSQQDIGAFLGSKGALDSIISVAFTSIGMSIYAATVAWKPEALFILSAIGYLVAVGLSLSLRSGLWLQPIRL